MGVRMDCDPSPARHKEELQFLVAATCGGLLQFKLRLWMQDAVRPVCRRIRVRYRMVSTPALSAGVPRLQADSAPGDTYRQNQASPMGPGAVSNRQAA